MSETNDKTKYIAALDVGTTTIRCFIYDNNVQIVGKASDKVNNIYLKKNLGKEKFTSHTFFGYLQIELLYPQPGYVEINPDELWRKIISVIVSAIEDAKLNSKDIACLGISTQRSTFITWDRTTGENFHNFVTWKDLRADSMVRKWNDSVTLKVSKLILFFI